MTRALRAIAEFMWRYRLADITPRVPVWRMPGYYDQERDR